jgi:hypothetical protein
MEQQHAPAAAGEKRTKKKASPPSPEMKEEEAEETGEEDRDADAEEETEEEEEEDMDIDDEEDARRRVLEQRRKIDADEQYEADWTDKKQYFPIDLAVFDAQKRAEEMSLNDAAEEERDGANEKEEEKKVFSRRKRNSIAQTLENLRASKGEKLVAWQLPPDLPLANDSNRNNAAVAGRNNNTNRRDAERTTSGAGNAANRSNKSKKHKKLLEVADLRAGQLGEIEVYADGTAKLVIGECRFDLDNGAEYRHHEQFVIIDEKKKKCAFVGDIVGRVVATPDVDQLIEQSLKEESDSDDDDDNDDGDSDVDITNADND